LNGLLVGHAVRVVTLARLGGSTMSQTVVLNEKFLAGHDQQLGCAAAADLTSHAEHKK
jgi:hypothetical protein